MSPTTHPALEGELINPAPVEVAACVVVLLVSVWALKELTAPLVVLVALAVVETLVVG
jgi:hypothetical protein